MIPDRLASLTRFVVYYRASPAALDLQVQRDAADRIALGGVIAAEFVEKESGRRQERPKLMAALDAARDHRAILIIAKLDRLARSAPFLHRLMASGVEFVAADLPALNRLSLPVLAAVAEAEALAASTLTKAGLAAAKARGVRLGNPNLAGGSTIQASAAKSRRAHIRAAELQPFIEQARHGGARTLQQLADALTERGVATPAGRRLWHPVQVSRLLRR